MHSDKCFGNVTLSMMYFQSVGPNRKNASYKKVDVQCQKILL